MHTLRLQVDDSIFDKFMGLLDILPKEKISVSDESNSISFEEAEAKVQNAINNISNKDGIELDDAFDKAVEIMYNTKGKCIITGVGKSGLIGAKIAATLASTGTPSFFIHPTEALHGDLGMIGPQDSVLAISYSGESEELIKILPHIKRFDIPLIATAGKDDSTLAKYGDVFLSIQVE